MSREMNHNETQAVRVAVRWMNREFETCRVEETLWQHLEK